MDRGYRYHPELLQMMLSEERQKFVSALGKASWKELNRIRKNIAQINALLDSMSAGGSGHPRSDRNGDR